VFNAFANDSEVLNIQGDALTVSNGTTRVTLSGTLELTKDQRGLQAALALKQALDRVVETLQVEANLPERIKDEPDATHDVVDNPFN
jgi:flagellar hook-basal body complex protein FliE